MRAKRQGSIPKRMGRRRAAVLLSGGRSSADRDRLADLLAAAAGRPLDHELCNRDAVLAAFAQGPAECPPDSDRGERRPGRRAGWVWAWPVHVAAALPVVLLIGMAAATRAGVLPAPIQNVAHRLLSGAGVPPPAQQDHDRSGGSSGPEGPASADETRGTEPGDDPDKGRELCLKFLEARRDGDVADPADLAALAR